MATAGGSIIADGVHDDPERPPDPDPVKAPKGWTWAREERRWKPRIRGPLLAAIRQQQDQPPQQQQQQQQQQDQAPGDGWQRRDPDPAWMQDQDRPRPPVYVPDDETRADIKALIALAYTLPSEALPLLDPYCFGPLATEHTATAVISAVTDIVCGSPRIAAWAASAAGLMPWIKLSIALKPIAVAALHHHILRDVEVELDRENRTMTVARRDWAEYPAA